MFQLRFVAESLNLQRSCYSSEGKKAPLPCAKLARRAQTAETAQKRHRNDTEEARMAKEAELHNLKLLYGIPLCVPGSQGSRPTSTKKCALTELLVLASMV